MGHPSASSFDACSLSAISLTLLITYSGIASSVHWKPRDLCPVRKDKKEIPSLIIAWSESDSGLDAWRRVVLVSLYTSQYAPNVTDNVSTLTGPLPCTIAAGLYLRMH